MDEFLRDSDWPSVVLLLEVEMRQGVQDQRAKKSDVQAVVDGMLDKTLASEYRGQGSNPAARPMCEAGGLTYPVIQVYGRPNSVTGDAFYQWWGLDVLSNERRLAGGCRCPLR